MASPGKINTMKNNNLQKIGGWSSIGIAATWLVGFAVFLGILAPSGYFEANTSQKVMILANNQVIVSASYLIAFVVFGALLIVLVLALYERLKGAGPLAQVATVFGLLWAGLVIGSGMVANVGIAKVVDLFAHDPVQAGMVWTAVETVQLGLGGGNEIVGGLWVLLISWTALRANKLPKKLNYLGVASGVAGLLTIVPFLEVLGAVDVLGFVFGLGLIVWFVWLGVVMLGNGASRTDHS
jgi:hypothetical protein